MKVLHISRTMGQGGAEKIVWQICSDVHTCEHIVMSTGGPYVEQLNRIGVKHIIIPDIEKKDLKTFIYCFNKIFVTVKKEKIDVIHAHHRMAALYANLISKVCDVKIVYTAHNIFEDKRIITRLSLKNEVIVAVGDSVKKNLIDYFGIKESQIVTIKNTIKVNNNLNYDNKNISLLNNLSKNGHKLIGTIGRLSRQKGIDIFLQAFQIISLKDSNAIAIIVGDGEDKIKLINLAENLGIMSKVVFLGYCSNVSEVIEQLDFIVLASRWEGLPLTPIEVFSKKKTLVASDIPSNKEIIKDGYNGILFKLDNPIDLSNKILKLLNNENSKAMLEDNAYNTYISDYSYEKFVCSYSELYRSITRNE